MAEVKENPKGNYEIPGSQLYVSRLGNVWRLFGENEISKSKFGLKWRIYFFSALSTPFQWIQRFVLMFTLRNVIVDKKPPVFILGHWRSGTTHVNNVLAKDKQFVFLNNYQGFFFNICMLGLGWMDKILAPYMPKVRPQDNMDITLYDPQEEEQSIGNVSYTAGIHSFYFPKNRSYFYKFNLFKGISEKEYADWKKNYIYTLKAIMKMGKGGTRVLTKNPNNTARIKQLLELFPEAKFVHIHRNPFEVYLSTKHLHRVILRGQSMQDFSEAEEDNIILENYKLMQQQYLETRKLVPKDSLIDLAYSDIGSENELALYEDLYKKFGLENWDNIKTELDAYLKSLRTYRTDKANRFIPIDAEMVKRIQTEWRFMFEEYGYDLEYKDKSLMDNE